MNTSVQRPTVPSAIASLNRRVDWQERPDVGETPRGGYELSAPSTLEVSTGDVTSPWLIRRPTQFVDAVAVCAVAIANDLIFEVRRNGVAIFTVTIEAGNLFSTVSPPPNPTALGHAGIDVLTVACVDDGGGGYGAFNVQASME